jgi:hypothetical protein
LLPSPPTKYREGSGAGSRQDGLATGRGNGCEGMRQRAGLDPAIFAGHSLRSGFLTSAKRRASLFKMMDVSRHKSVDTLRGYVRDAELFTDHAGAGLL